MMTRKHSHAWYIVAIVVLVAVAAAGAFQSISLQQARDALGNELSGLDATLSALQVGPVAKPGAVGPGPVGSPPLPRVNWTLNWRS